MPSHSTKTKLILADPGTPKKLPHNTQLLILLEESINQMLKHGLWPTLSSLLKWTAKIKENTTANEKELLKGVKKYEDKSQNRLVTKQKDGRHFNGRIFSDVVLRLGSMGNRGMSREEAKWRLDGSHFGHIWYSGVDSDLIEIIQSENVSGLLEFGVGSESDGGRPYKSAYLMENEEMTEDAKKAIKRDLEIALKRW